MEPQHPRPSRPLHHLNLLPAGSVSSPSSPQPSASYHHLSGITPASSPGVFSPASSSPHAAFSSPILPHRELSIGSGNPTPPNLSHSNSYKLPHLPVRETHIANIERDYATGRKTINDYQVLEEIGRGQHGKVKLAQTAEGHFVAIKIIPRLSKTRRLGRVSAADPQQNTKREIAILKKIRHPNVVALLEVIDDPELQKIYMVLEHVERGEVTWRKKGLPNICYFERYRFELGMHGKQLAPGEYNWQSVLDRQATIRALKEARAAGLPPPVNDWTTRYKLTADSEGGEAPWWFAPSAGLGPAPEVPFLDSRPVSRVNSRAPSRVASVVSLSSGLAPADCRSDESMSVVAQDGDAGYDTPSFLFPGAQLAQAQNALDGSMFGAYVDDNIRRQRSPSLAGSIISQMSGMDYNTMVHDPYADDFSYVPCFSIEQARSAFRDTVLGLEYLHYHGVVHRDIKPANLLWTADHKVKISDFGVSYFGRPIRDGDRSEASVPESEAKDFDDDRELSKTVGTPAFFAPELCYTDIDTEPPKVSEQIDVWSLGVTLYCLLYARIPFLAEDEFSMFKKIATEDAYISPRRLKPVDAYTDPAIFSLYNRVNVHPFRSDADPEYEELSESLVDLLKKMLVKNPNKRIRLRDVKRHPWVTEDIPDVPQWLEDTNPARTQDRRIHVDDAEIGSAVVPLNFLERARTAMKRAVGKVMHSRDRDEHNSSPATPSRMRASSSASNVVNLSNPPETGSAAAAAIAAAAAAPPHHFTGTHSGNDQTHGHGQVHALSHHGRSLGHHYTHHTTFGTHHINARDARRKSLRGDDYFATVTQMPILPTATTTASAANEHPLAQSVTASPYASPGEPSPAPQAQGQAQSTRARAQPEMRAPMHGEVFSVDGSIESSAHSHGPTYGQGLGQGHTINPPRNLVRHVHSRSISNAILSRSSILREIHASSSPPPESSPTFISNSNSNPNMTIIHSPPTTNSPILNAVRRTREVRATSDANARTRSVDRAGIVFSNPDKRAGPVVGLNVANAPGSLQQPRRPVHRASSSGLAHVDTISETKTTGSDETINVHTMNNSTSVSSPQVSSLGMGLSPIQQSFQQNFHRVLPLLEDRPTTAHRVEMPAAPTMSFAAHAAAAAATSTLAAPAPATQVMPGGRSKSNSLSALSYADVQREIGITALPTTVPPVPRVPSVPSASAEPTAAPTAAPTVDNSRPPSPTPQLGQAAEIRRASEVNSAITTATSSSSTSLERDIEAVASFNHTPLTSPSEVNNRSFVGSAHHGHRKGSSNAMMTFQSDPSLPALLSGASSVSADMEADYLCSPGVVGPPLANNIVNNALGKEAGVTLEQVWGSGGAIPVQLDSRRNASSDETKAERAARTPIATPVRGNSRNFTDEEDDSDSDGGIIMMAKSKKKSAPFSRDSTPLPGQSQSTATPSAHAGRAQAHMARRRDTNTSIGSTDTAKKVSVNAEN